MLEREIPEQIHQCIILCVAGGRNYFQGEKTGGIPGGTGFPCFAMGQTEKVAIEIDFFKDKDSVLYHIYYGNYDKAESLLQSIEMDDGRIFDYY